ncbi:hypothetical protein Ae717Ps2_6890c [Pseudonocardia sp. Ae717_Ps2]|uniref:DUF3307 domain-containing protein n=2 Tax=Pseudonocardia sp. Ae717_Ps2 TaxID=1885573 RepID=UPI00094AD6BC|nr:DUF3307 domain-containing protein [Pseudonocardia sp. Ae717_Ps2]OLM27642.1 hypothetical protein Ae717Ps2_7253 [Pseudonocardia sp. Ae717_Ps2]OLM28040.1 hypothetical protein Ae717Ps2_6890c [Pseudonocardia sp. Ae717_Ps2]
MSERIAITVLTALGALLGHHGGDYLAQDDCMSAHKQHRTGQGRRELALHASTYAAAQAVTKWAFYRTAGVRVPWLAQLTGVVAEGVVHAVIDDGRLLARFAAIPGRQRDEHGARIGRQKRFHGLADHGVNGRALMDQAVHHQVQIPVGVAVTTAVAALIAR